MKICLSSTASPWFFGPYGNQLLLVAKYLLNLNYDVHYLYLIGTEMRVYSYQELIELDTRRIDHVDGETLSKIKFIGGIRGGGNILVSNINEICEHFQIDHLLFLMDLTCLCIDNFFQPTSYIWYPNHFNPISTINKTKLQVFDKVISLSNADKVLINKELPTLNVSYVPHIIDIKPPPSSKNQLRQKYNFEQNDFVIFMNIGNYDLQNRKSLDTALFAFEEFLKTNDGILFIHTYNVRDLDIHNHHTPMVNFFEIQDLLQYLTIPDDKIRIINSVVSPLTLSEYYMVSDVLLQTSKSEGFGLPILEAQRLGLSVITTKFGGMEEHTYNGISVTPCQKSYDNIGCGIWCTPSIHGVTEALHCTKNNPDQMSTRNWAKDLITDKMSYTTVGKSIEQLFKTTVKTTKVNNQTELLQIIRYTETHYILDGQSCSKIMPTQIYGKWVILLKDDTVLPENNELLDKLNTLTWMNPELDVILLPTQYSNQVYPTNTDIAMGNLKHDRVNYLINGEIVKKRITSNILHQYMKDYMLLSTASTGKCMLLDTVTLVENTDH